jgi:phosphoenolpyruvate synthase/pyruvate phosphate dikinase
MRIFVSYAGDDLRFAGELFGILSQQQFQIVRGSSYFTDAAWQKEIAACPVVLYILSQASADCEPCTAQWEYAIAHGLRLIILKLDAVPIPEPLRRANLIDYLDFEQIGRQLAEGVPILSRDRYASEVTLRMLIAELAEVRRLEVAGLLRPAPGLAPAESPSEDHDTIRLPSPQEIQAHQKPDPAAVPKTWEQRPLAPLKRLAKHLRRLRREGQEGESDA